MTLMAIDRMPEIGQAWAVTYPDREEVAIGIGWALPVVSQPDSGEPYPGVDEGEVLLDHYKYGLIVVQSFDCDYEEREVAE